MRTVRTIEPSEIQDWVRQLSVGFHFEVAPGFPEYVLGTIDLDRAWASFDGERVVGTLRSWATELTVPGPRQVRAAALTNVTVAPTHRRQGRLTEMIDADLRASAARGEAVGVLIASEYPIYGRFGYGPATQSARYTVMTKEATFRRPPTGTVELSDLATLREEGPALYDRFRVSQPGSIERSASWWDRSLRRVEVPGDEPAKGQVALYRSPTGELEGYLRYDAASDWDGMRPQGVLHLRELLSTSRAAYAALWSFCCGVDLLTTIDAGQRSTDEALPHLLTDGRAVKLAGVADFMWVRVLDVCAALSGRNYAVPGRLVMEVTDAMGISGGRFAVEGGHDGATCTPTTQSAQLTVPVDVLGSAYLGGASLRTLEFAGRLDEHQAGAVARADAMFRDARPPWCTTWF